MKKNIAFILISFLTPQVLFAHGIGQRIDLPIPLDIYLGAAAAVLIFSFFLIAFLGKKGKSYEQYPSIDLFRPTWVRTLFQSVISRVGIGLFTLFLFGVLLYAGFWGDQTPTQNILPIFVWVGFTVGFTYFVAFVGNVWPMVNPWAALHVLLDRKERWSFKLPWPTNLGVWPAFFLFVIFRFLENIFPYSTEPRTLAYIILGFTVISLVGMTVFGRAAWLRGGDPFSVFYRFLSLFSIISLDDDGETKKLRLRLPGIGLLSVPKVSFSEMSFVLLMLATVSFDGISSTPFSAGILTWFLDNGVGLILAKTILFVLVFVAFFAVYILFTLLIRKYAHSGETLLVTAKQFVLSLLPIAIVYEVAHFTTLLITEGQRVFILASDPFGYGWNLFGTAEIIVNYGFINFKLLWNIEIALILIGHIISIYIAHMVALAFYMNPRAALRSQIPMLVLMVVYTVMGLWILAQPPVLIL